MSTYRIYKALQLQKSGKWDLLGKGLLLLFGLFLLSSYSFGQTYLLDGTVSSVSTCSGTLYDSGGDTGDYGSNEDYEITFYSSTGESLLAEIAEFWTLGNQAYLYVYDGSSSATGTLLGTYVGQLTESYVLISTGDCLTFRFVSNTADTRPGFRINISCIPLATDLTIDQEGSHSLCSGILYDSGGPTSGYSDTEDYTITFNSVDGYALAVDFLSFDLGSVNSDDVLRIYDGPDTGSDLIVELIGEDIPGLYTSSGSSMTFRFIAIDNGPLPWDEGEGFAARISCVPIAPEHSLVDDGTLNTCLERIYDDGGQANSYAPNQTITQNICSDDGTSAILIDFRFADYIGVDYLRVYDGTNASGDLLYTITGSDIPSGPLISSGTCLSLQSYSNNNDEGAGFVADVSCTPIVPGVLISDTDLGTCGARLYDTGGQSGNYSAGENESITICSANGGTLDATISSMDIRDGDYLYIYDGTSSSDPLLASFTSTTAIQGPYASSGTCLTFEFTSDNAGSTGAGFSIDITCDPTSNTINLTSAAGTDDQSVCISTALSDITYATTGATGAIFSGLPPGVSGSWSADEITISGIPTASGTYNYTVTLTGGSGTGGATGTITVESVSPPDIIGPLILCNPSTTSYTVADPSGYTFLWTVTNGTIIGSASNSTVDILWNTAGPGTVAVEITSGSGCTSSNSINVNVNSIADTGEIQSSALLIRR